jgi:hypothetical protein
MVSDFDSWSEARHADGLRFFSMASETMPIRGIYSFPI